MLNMLFHHPLGFKINVGNSNAFQKTDPLHTICFSFWRTSKVFPLSLVL